MRFSEALDTLEHNRYIVPISVLADAIGASIKKIQLSTPHFTTYIVTHKGEDTIFHCDSRGYFPLAKFRDRYYLYI